MGRGDKPRGLLKSDGASEKIIPFMQDSKYYLQKGSYYNQKNKLSKALLFLKKAIEVEPGNAHHHYNLACLLSKTSQLQEANRVFKKIVDSLNPELTECYFLMAVNCGLMDDMEQAKNYLQEYLQRSPEGDMAFEAMDLLDAMEEKDGVKENGNNFTVQDNRSLERFLHEVSLKSLLHHWKDYSFRHALQKGLYQGSDSLKEKVLRIYGKVGAGEAERALRDYIVSPWVNDRLRDLALEELKEITDKNDCRIFLEGRIVEVNLHEYDAAGPLWEDKWQGVLDCVLEHMSAQLYYGEEFFEDVRAIWLDYINRVYPRVPGIREVRAWAAALEYSLGRFHFLGVTQKKMAGKYGVSVSTVGCIYRQINSVLHIDQKAYRNMLTFLAHQDME